jgi:hypothetical protein
MEFGRGIFEGVTGVVMAPVRGAEQEGVVGFGKGLVKGEPRALVGGEAHALWSWP